MNLLFWFYVFGSAVVIAGGAYYFYKYMNQSITAGIFFVGILVITIVFGLRWFPASGATVLPTGKWPPVVNYCPDFLTLYVVGGKQVCIDTVGVAQAGGISKWSDPTQTDDTYLFNLFTDTSGDARVAALCDQAKDKKVSWEGVWNGVVCSGVEPPKPPSTP